MAKSPLTGNDAKFVFSQAVLGRHEARYFLDEQVGYIFVEEPHWLDEAYSSAISVSDTGILYRNIRNIHELRRLIRSAGYPFCSGVDLGGGYGVFVRGMRDAGFDFRWSDKYASNLFARGFEAVPGKYDVAVCFEVLEHVPNPLGFLRDARTEYNFDTCFFSASCFDETAPPDRDWWYWLPETGQHISFFSEKALRWIAGELGMKLFHFGHDIYAFSTWDWSTAEAPSGSHKVRNRLARALLPAEGPAPELPRNSLLGPDFEAMRTLLRSRTAKD